MTIYLHDTIRESELPAVNEVLQRYGRGPLQAGHTFGHALDLLAGLPLSEAADAMHEITVGVLGDREAGDGPSF